MLLGEFHIAADMLKGLEGSEGKELLDVCYLRLGELGKIEEDELCIGLMKAKTNRGGESEFRKVLEKDGWCWTAIEGLSKMGGNSRISETNITPKINELMHGIKYKPTPEYGNSNMQGTPYSSGSPFQGNFGTPNLTPINPQKVGRTVGKTMSRINFRDTGRSGFSEESSVRGGSDGTSALTSFLRTYTLALNAYHNYSLPLSQQLYNSLPPHLLNSAYVQKQLGLIHFELSNYSLSKLHLEASHNLSPNDVRGLEVLSTVYWHLKQDVELSYLARRVSERSPNKAESWIVVGNCFSLQKEHDLALKFFQRALTISPNFTYAHTLSGHEYVSNEDFTSAITCFRLALSTDQRHYNAWYGLGAIYYRQEKWELAGRHFERAIEVNPGSSILYCHLGMVRQAEKRYFEAFEVLEKAFELEPSNPQARYQLATVLISLERYPEALKSLYLVRDSAPREASVYFLIGNVHKKLGENDKAMVNFVMALDLDPKDNNLIKAAIDRLDEPDVEEDASGF
ncbi:hypothetical protein TL16_g08843 [Triparma laevis f. inornata]|uniref:Uncharacterized protein n=1 Tax=Triparma laevis f. inornata TaxID=1714386 RepID=A0A9W7EHF4_9STRA|nr:hypothetical protein TL16_g08843 [Triparma laevis f. inornata]